MYDIFVKILPRGLKENYISLLVSSNVRINAKRFIGFVLIFGFVLALAIGFNLGALLGWNVILVFFSSFLIIELGIYMWLYLSGESKRRFIEDVFPDALQLMVSNLKSGITVDKAFLLAARKEFGPLSDEIRNVGKEIATGKNVSEALFLMNRRIRSDKIEKTIMLIITGLRAGGHLASLLEQTANNLREQKFVEEKVRTNVLMYAIFILSAIGFAAPLLFALSSFLVEVLNDILKMVEIPAEVVSYIPIKVIGSNIDFSFIMYYVVIFLIVNSLFASMLIGLIYKNQEKYGLKYFPLLVMINTAVFFLVRYIISSFLKNLFSF